MVSYICASYILPLKAVSLQGLRDSVVIMSKSGTRDSEVESPQTRSRHFNFNLISFIFLFVLGVTRTFLNLLERCSRIFYECIKEKIAQNVSQFLVLSAIY